MSEKISEWGVTSYDASRFKLIHIDSSKGEDLLEGHIDDDDARLIAAAPELLEALENLERTAGLPAMSDDPVRVAARAAIAKARGEQG